MTRILYGVQGDGTGHVNRARTIAQHLPNVKFLFVGGKTVHSLEKDGFEVVEVPVLDTIYRNNRVDNYATVKHALTVFANRNTVIKKIIKIIESFDPDTILTDYEYFTAISCQRMARPCISLDHQHVLTHCVGSLPNRHSINGLMTKAIIRGLFSAATHYLIVSFFTLPPKNPESTEVFSAIVNRVISEQKPICDDHVLVYLTSSTFNNLFPILAKMHCPFKIYGLGAHPARGNLIFKERSREGFIRDLATSRYVIVNGGHNTISEALYLGKPVFSFPIDDHYEQYTNAFFLRHLGYGEYCTNLHTALPTLQRFENRLDDYRDNIRAHFSVGNNPLINRLKEIMTHV
jgi:uncharacterized protein (TIGR00661 family)